MAVDGYVIWFAAVMAGGCATSQASPQMSRHHGPVADDARHTGSGPHAVAMVAAITGCFGCVVNCLFFNSFEIEMAPCCCSMHIMLVCAAKRTHVREQAMQNQNFCKWRSIGTGYELLHIDVWDIPKLPAPPCLHDHSFRGERGPIPFTFHAVSQVDLCIWAGPRPVKTAQLSGPSNKHWISHQVKLGAPNGCSTLFKNLFPC